MLFLIKSSLVHTRKGMIFLTFKADNQFFDKYLHLFRTALFTHSLCITIEQQKDSKISIVNVITILVN